MGDFNGTGTHLPKANTSKSGDSETGQGRRRVANEGRRVKESVKQKLRQMKSELCGVQRDCIAGQLGK